MTRAENKELWTFVGKVTARLDNGDKQFVTTRQLLTDLKSDVSDYHIKLDKHLTLHKYFNRIVASIGTVVAAITGCNT